MKEQREQHFTFDFSTTTTTSSGMPCREAFDSQFLNDEWSAIGHRNLEDRSSSNSRTGSGTNTAEGAANPRFDEASLILALLQSKSESPYSNDDFGAEEYKIMPAFEDAASAADAAAGSDGRIRCFDHGCGGRAFSSPENYRRHIRERQRPVDAVCMFCLASFTRKSNRDQHILNGKCKMSSGRHE